MAKVTGPLMSLDASGTVGHTAVFSKWKGRNYVRLRVTPTNNQTSDQQDARIRTGGIGHLLSFVLTPFGADRGSTLYEAFLSHAPAGQSWISYAIRTILGSGFSTFDSNSTTYDALGSPVKTVYSDAADTLGITDFDIAVVGAITSIAKGKLVYMLLKAAIVAGVSYGVTDTDTVTTGDLDDFIDGVNVAAT